MSICGCHSSNKDHFQGYIEAENTYLASPYSGLLMVLAVHRGDLVKKGQLLFQLDRNPQAIVIDKSQQEIAEAKHVLQDLSNPQRPPEISAIEAQIAQVEANIDLAAVRVRRYQQLYDRKVGSKDTLDEAVENLKRQKKLKEQYQANLELAKLGSREEQIRAQQRKIASLTAQYEEAKWELDQKQKVAPEAGLIFDTYFTVGEFVAAGQAVLSLISAKHVYATFFVPVETLQRIKLKQQVGLRVDGLKQEGEGIIDYISPEAEYLPPLVYSRDNNDKIVFRIKARIPDYLNYKPGLPITVILK